MRPHIRRMIENQKPTPRQIKEANKSVFRKVGEYIWLWLKWLIAAIAASLGITGGSPLT